MTKVGMQILSDIMSENKEENDFDYEWCDNCGEWVHTHDDETSTCCDVCGQSLHILTSK